MILLSLKLTYKSELIMYLLAIEIPRVGFKRESVIILNQYKNAFNKNNNANLTKSALRVRII